MVPLSPEGCVVWKLSGNYFKESFNLRSSFLEDNVTMTKSLEKNHRLTCENIQSTQSIHQNV